MVSDHLELDMLSDSCGFDPPTLRMFRCPRCKKERLLRPRGHTVITEEKEFKLQDGRIIKHHIDVCKACEGKIIAEFYTPRQKDLAKVIKALHDPSNSDLDEKSLEELL